jgi:hypothetical protein
VSTASHLAALYGAPEQQIARLPLSEAVKHRAYLLEVEAHAGSILAALREGGSGWIGYDCRQSPIDGGYYFNDVGEAASALALHEGLTLRWMGCDDIGMSAEIVGSHDSRWVR